MGSMADVNTPEKTLEANEGVSQVTGVPVVAGTLPEVAGEHAAMPDPKSPPAGKGDKPDEADVEILELPGSDRKREKSPEIERGDVKRLCATLETQLPSVLEKLHEGYKLTAESLEAVKERTALDKQMQKDLSELARSHGSEHISQKYFLSIMQENLKRAENLEWQVGGPKSEANTSLKSISNKILGAQTATKEGLKALHGEMREGNERVVQAITDGFSKLTAAMVTNAPPVKEASAPAYPPVPPPTMPPGTPPAGSSVTSTYGLPGYASSYGMPNPNLLTPNVLTSNAPMVNTPQTPAGVGPTSMGSMGNTSTGPVVAAAARNEPQPPMVLLVADEAGARRRVAFSPTRHLSSNNLTQSYLQEFGLGCVYHAGGYHRRLPDVFLPK